MSDEQDRHNQMARTAAQERYRVLRKAVLALIGSIDRDIADFVFESEESRQRYYEHFSAVGHLVSGILVREETPGPDWEPMNEYNVGPYGPSARLWFNTKTQEMDWFRVEQQMPFQWANLSTRFTV